MKCASDYCISEMRIQSPLKGSRFDDLITNTSDSMWIHISYHLQNIDKKNSVQCILLDNRLTKFVCSLRIETQKPVMAIIAKLFSQTIKCIKLNTPRPVEIVRGNRLFEKTRWKFSMGATTRRFRCLFLDAIIRNPLNRDKLLKK